MRLGITDSQGIGRFVLFPDSRLISRKFRLTEYCSSSPPPASPPLPTASYFFKPNPVPPHVALRTHCPGLACVLDDSCSTLFPSPARRTRPSEAAPLPLFPDDLESLRSAKAAARAAIISWSAHTYNQSTLPRA